MFKEHIEYGNPKMLEEAMRKENFCYDQNKNKWENVPTWNNKRPNNFDQERSRTSSKKTQEITIGGIRVITTKYLNHRILW